MPDFRSAIAIDERIKKVSAALGVSFARYADHERYYQELAKYANLEPWELDRVLYGNLSDVLRVIGSSSRNQKGRAMQSHRVPETERDYRNFAIGTKETKQKAIDVILSLLHSLNEKDKERLRKELKMQELSDCERRGHSFKPIKKYTTGLFGLGPQIIIMACSKCGKKTAS